MKKTPEEYMICDIGSDITEISVISEGDIVISNMIRTAGNDFDEAVINNPAASSGVCCSHKVLDSGLIPFKNAPEGQGIKPSPRIKNAESGLIKIILDEIELVLSITPQELAAGILKRGIVLKGKGSLIKGLSKLISKETGLPVNLASEKEL